MSEADPSEGSVFPWTRPAYWPPCSSDRFAAAIERESPDGCRIALLGVPDDTGVVLNHGRAGANLGPGALRAALARGGSAYDGFAQAPILTRVYDAGDLEVAGGHDAHALRETHRRLRETTRALHERGLTPVVVGGGHDLSYPAIMGLFAADGERRRCSGLSLDAHLDVRETEGSGMPFRRLIEEGALDPRRFAVVGTGPFANSEAHVEWAAGLGATLVACEAAVDQLELLDHAFASAFQGTRDIGFVTICLDALDRAHAPGVSAPNPLGLSARHAARLARLAGRDPRVRHFDLMELSPPNDIQDATARLAALLFLCFVSEYDRRQS